MFNYNHLFYFYITAKTGSVTKAAQILHISQPSLSAQLKVLENALGKQLIKKVGRKIELTYIGKIVHGHCIKIFEAANALADYLESSDEKSFTKVKIGVSQDLEHPFVTDLIGDVLKTKSSNRPAISMLSASNHELIELLQTDQLDFLLTNRTIYGHGDVFKNIASINMPVVLVASKKLVKGFRSNEISGTNIQNFLNSFPGDLVLPSEKLRIRIETDLFLQRHHVEKKVVFECDILASVIRAIAEGVGIGLIPLPYIKRELEQGTLIWFGPAEGYWQQRLLLISTKRKELDDIGIEMRNMILKI